MLGRSDIDRIEDPVHHVRAVAGQQRSDVDMSFLQILIRIKLIKSSLQLTMRSLIARHLGTNETSFQSIELIVNLLSSRIKRSRKRRIYASEFLSQTIELKIDVLLRVCKELRRVGAKVLFNHTLHHRLESFKEICELQIVSFQHASGVALNHGQTRTWQDRRRWPFEHAINFSRLCEVSNFCGAAVVSDGRQQVVLDHSTQRHVRTESLRCFKRHGGKFFGAVLLLEVSGLVVSIFETRNCVSSTVVIVQK